MNRLISTFIFAMAILPCSNKQIRNDGIYPVINLNPESNELSHKNGNYLVADDALFIGEAAKIDVFNFGILYIWMTRYRNVS